MSETSDRPSLSFSFAEERSGFVLVTRDDLNAKTTSQQTFLTQPDEANASIAHLQEQLRNPATQPVANASHPLEESMKTLIELNSERRLLTYRLEEAKEEVDFYERESTKQQKLVKSYEDDYNALSADYDYLDDLHKRTQKLFTSKISEVFRLQSELKEVRIRAKAPEGCLNCNMSGHSFRTCRSLITVNSAKSISTWASAQKNAHGPTSGKKNLRFQNIVDANSAEGQRICQTRTVVIAEKG